MKNAIVKVEDLVVDPSIYPRKKESWVTAYDYAQSMNAGAVFPPVVVAKFKGKDYLIDGWHRVQAYKKNEVEYIEAELIKVKDKSEMYLEAVKLNATHGRPFSFVEKIAIMHNLEKMKVDPKTISHILGMTVEKMEIMKVKRITYTHSGKPVVLKAPMKHLAGKKLVNGELEVQEEITGVRSQVQLIDMVIDMLEQGAFDMNNKVVTKKIESLHETIEKKMVKA